MATLNPPAFLQSGNETAAVTRLAVGSAVTGSGIVGAGDLLVTAPGGVMQVSVAAGTGWVLGSRAYQGAYHVVNDAPVTLTIAASDPTNPRYDRIVAEIKDTAYAGGTNTFALSIIQGTPASSPVEPAIPADSFELARILVPAASTTVTSGNVLDRRVAFTSAYQIYRTGPGAAVQASIISGDTVNSGTYQNATPNSGPSVTTTIPASGRIWVNLKADLGYAAANSDGAYMSFTMSGANTATAAAMDALGYRLHYIPSSASQPASCSGRFLLTGLTPGSTTFNCVYNSGPGGSNAQFNFRFISIEPA